MDVGAAFVADAQAAMLVKPGDRPLDDPTAAAEARPVRIVGLGDPDLHSAPAQLAPRLARVIGAVAVDLFRSSPGTPAAPAHRRNRIDERHELADVVDVRGGRLRRQRAAAPAGDQMVLGTAPSAVDRARAGTLAPPKARTCEESIAARSQSI